MFLIVGRRSRYHSPFISHRCDKSPGTSSQPRVATLSPGRPMCSSSPLCHTKELRNNDFQNMLFDNHVSILPPSLFPLLIILPVQNGIFRPLIILRYKTEFFVRLFSGTKRNFSSFGRPAFLGSQNEKAGRSRTKFSSNRIHHRFL